MKIVECPRDAIQGINYFIPTKAKAAYINELLRAGFDTIDFGSFVSPQAIPQMRDTAKVLDLLNLSATGTKLLAIVANERGAQEACQFQQISHLGYPFSVSETFQQRNTKTGIAGSLERVKAIQVLCAKHNKQLVVYISMGFGNPYGDDWNADIVQQWITQLRAVGITIFSIADTVGMATPRDIESLFTLLNNEFCDMELGVHLHTTAESCLPKITAAYQAGCRRFDTAILGFGGCPMAADDLVGNLPTDKLIAFLNKKDNSVSLSAETIARLESSFKNLIAH